MSQAEMQGFCSLPACLLEAIAGMLSLKERLTMCAVNRHWQAALTGSPSLWAQLDIDLSHASEARVEQMLAFAASRSHVIQGLELTLGEAEQWPQAAFLLGMLRPTLRRAVVVAASPACELSATSGLSFFAALRGLTSLDLDNCVASLSPSLGQLTALQELLVSQDELSWECEVPRELGRLTRLTRLELVRCCCGALPPAMTALTALRLLNLDGSDFYGCVEELSLVLGSLTNLGELDLASCNLNDVPAALSRLTSLTTLSLNNSCTSGSLSAATWADKLGCLSSLSRLLFLELAENGLTAVPASVTGLSKLETLKLGLNPLTEAGLLDGPYLDSLLHLDLRACRLAALPPHLTRAQKLQFLGLSCCHELALDRAVAEGVVGQLAALKNLTLCGQSMHSVESARFAHALGRMLPSLEILSHEEDSDDDDDDDEDDDSAAGDGSEEEDESEFETDADDVHYNDDDDNDDDDFEGEEEWEPHYW